MSDDPARESCPGWRTSTHTLGNGACVEVCQHQEGEVAVRDSKDPGGTVLIYAPANWKRFVTALKDAA